MTKTVVSHINAVVLPLLWKKMHLNVDFLIKFICVLLINKAVGNLNDYELTCKDENGQNVDWLVIYELKLNQLHIIGTFSI